MLIFTRKPSRFSVLVCIDSVERRCFVRKVVLRHFANSQENICSRVPFLIKLQAQACDFVKKESLSQMPSCEFCRIPKNTFFTEHLQTTASGFLMKSGVNTSPAHLYFFLRI